MEWKYVKKLKDVNYITEVETKLKVTFPDELKELIINYNNGTPVPNSLDTQHLKGKCFGELLNFNLEGNNTNILQNYSWIGDKLPPNVIPFTVTPGGDYLCYDYRKDMKNPKIYYWDHEQIWEIDGDELVVPDHEKEYEYYRLDFVANNLNELLGVLYGDDQNNNNSTNKTKDFLFENYFSEDELKELSDESLAAVNERRAKKDLPPIVK